MLASQNVAPTGLSATVSPGTPTVSAGGSGGQVPLVLASDWSTAIGETTAAMLDTNKPVASRWTEFTNNTPTTQRSHCSVIAATGLGFPSGMANVLKVDQYATTFSDVRAVQLWRAPVGSEILVYRLYYRMDIPNSYGNLSVNAYHPIEAESGAPPNDWEIQLNVFGNGTYTFQWAWAGRHYQATLNKFQTYRFEWKFLRVGTSSFKLDVRVYNASNVLVVDRNNLINPNTSASLATEDLTGTIQDVYTSDTPNTSGTRSLTVGTNGPFGWDNVGTVTRDALTYYGGVAVAITTDPTVWLGPYVPGEHG